jgi:hypothetical protein
MTEAERNVGAAQKIKRILRPNEFELYDVVSDPYEVNDLAALSEHRIRIQTMHEQLKNLMLNSGESLTPKVPKKGKRKNQKK